MGNIIRRGVSYGGSGSINFAPRYSEFATYAIGDYAVMDGLLRRCITAITTPEPFNPVKWTIVNVGDELENKIDISNLVTVNNSGDVYIGTQCIRKTITQADYDLLDPPDPKCEYNIIAST